MIVGIDLTSIKEGGGIQVANGFLRDLNSDSNLRKGYTYIILTNVEIFDFELCDDFVIVECKLGSNLVQNTIKLAKIVNTFRIDVVFTLFGPAKFFVRVKHVLGFARPHILYPNSIFFNRLSLNKYVYYKVRYSLITFLFYLQSTDLIVETKNAKEKLESMYFYKSKNIHFVSNKLNPVFLEFDRAKFNPVPGALKILFVSSYYEHKNFEFFIDLALRLQNSKFKDKFSITLTISRADLELPENLENYFLFLGAVSINDIPSLYKECNVVIHPSLLEVFSACYIEALYMEKMLIVPNLEFTKAILKDAAFYMDGEYVESCVEILINKMDDYYNNQGSNDSVIADYMQSSSRTREYIRILST